MTDNISKLLELNKLELKDDQQGLLLIKKRSLIDVIFLVVGGLIFATTAIFIFTTGNYNSEILIVFGILLISLIIKLIRINRGKILCLIDRDNQQINFWE